MKTSEIIQVIEKHADKTFSDIGIDGFCTECIGCAAASSRPSKPVLLQISHDFILSDGGTCYKPRILKRIKGQWGEDIWEAYYNRTPSGARKALIKFQE